MKLIVILFFIFGVCAAIYLFFIHITKINWKAFIIAALFGLVLLVLTAVAIYRGSKAPDTWCDHLQNSMVYPPVEVKTAQDYFEKANYEYDTGRCKDAVADYTKSISLNGKYPQAYNNRAYTYMRMRDYKNALADLDKALTIDPNYINALMNRGDIHNYYFEIDKKAAIADYQKIISIAGPSGTGVCGHLVMAKTGGWNPINLFLIPLETFRCQDWK